MVSRFPELGEPILERRTRAASPRAATAGLAIAMMACGFADGDPIVTGSTTSTATSASSSGTSALMTVGSGSGGTVEGTADGSASSAEDSGTTPACACEGRQPGDRCLRFINECTQTIWAGASGLEEPAGAFDAVSRLDPQGCVAVTVTQVAGGRAWGATDCIDDVCASDGNLGQGTLIQFDLPAEGTDLYDVSLVDGFNLPMAMIPTGLGSAGGAEPCQSASCAADLTVVCPEALRRYDDDGELAYCASACRACDPCQGCDDCADLAAPACLGCGTFASFCCMGQACAENEHTMLWKSLCPDAITYSTDSSTFTCTPGADYDVVFCP